MAMVQRQSETLQQTIVINCLLLFADDEEEGDGDEDDDDDDGDGNGDGVGDGDGGAEGEGDDMMVMTIRQTETLQQTIVINCPLLFADGGADDGDGDDKIIDNLLCPCW